MLIGQLPDLRDTQAGKELIALGELKGREEGREQGELIGQVRMLSEILGITQPEGQRLAEMSIEGLAKQLADLRAQLQNR